MLERQVYADFSFLLAATRGPAARGWDQFHGSRGRCRRDDWPNEPPRDYVARLSREKARAVVRGDELALGADTTVVINGEIIGKPADAEEAGRMLRALSGQWHEVLTGVTLARADRIVSAVSSTRVKFAELSDAEIKLYVSTGEPMDKAGAYAIQGRASLFVERIEGSYSNVVGLPVQLTYQLARRMGVDLFRNAECGMRNGE